jgi:hypothetical protein
MLPSGDHGAGDRPHAQVGSFGAAIRQLAGFRCLGAGGRSLSKDRETTGYPQPRWPRTPASQPLRIALPQSLRPGSRARVALASGAPCRPCRCVCQLRCPSQLISSWRPSPKTRSHQALQQSLFDFSGFFATTAAARIPTDTYSTPHPHTASAVAPQREHSRRETIGSLMISAVMGCGAQPGRDFIASRMPV